MVVGDPIGVSAVNSAATRWNTRAGQRWHMRPRPGLLELIPEPTPSGRRLAVARREQGEGKHDVGAAARVLVIHEYWEKLLASCAAILLCCLVSGCSGAPSRVAAPSWEPEGLADAIMAKLDEDADSSLSATELTGAPGLAWGARYIDSDKNKSISRDELVSRFTMYKEMRLGIKTKQLQLSYKGRPVGGAKVTLVPEFFLDGIIESASGETLPEGIVDPIIPGEDLPGVRAGYYRVVVESPRVKIPQKYGSAETTTLGVEISPVSDDPRSYGMIQLVLSD